MECMHANCASLTIPEIADTSSTAVDTVPEQHMVFAHACRVLHVKLQGSTQKALAEGDHSDTNVWKRLTDAVQLAKGPR